MEFSSMEIIGRKREYKRIVQCLKSDEAQLIVVYGRRRVGKTFLIDSFFQKRYCFACTGAYKQSKEVQLTNFTNELNLQAGTDYSVPGNWSEAFMNLRKYLSSLDPEEKKIIFLDEMPWMDTRGSDFLPSFEWFWNSFASKQKNIVMIICGSAASWMKKNISDNKGGLYNRQTCRIYLEPFNLFETEQYLKAAGINWGRYEIAECYMIMGGIPYYLSLLSPDRSFGDNIDNLFFRKRAELWDEFTHLYNTLFTSGEQYIKVAAVLGGKRGGLTRSEIKKISGITSDANLQKILEGLTLSGFVTVRSYYGHKKRNCLYQLTDYYSLFYFRFIKDNYGKDEHFWSRSFDNPKRRSWEGLTFELICMDHINQIKQGLGISGVLTEESGWYSISDRNDGEKGQGTQIDMLIDRRDMSINICEIKFSVNEFEIDKNYDKAVRNRIESFRKATECRKTLIFTMITTFGVKQNKYSGIVNSQITLEDLFTDNR